VPGYEVELRDDDGRPLGPGAIGDLYVKGPSAALGYFGDRERTAATFQGGWVKTGDKFSCDADGRYIYAGRADDMIKVSGLYVSPVEVEGVLVRHPDVLEAAVVGVVDHAGLLKTKAFVVVKAGVVARPELGAELQAFVKQHLAPYKYPRAVEIVPELPKTATGKIQRFRLRAPVTRGAK
jgi:benzoate-CoA ligase